MKLQNKQRYKEKIWFYSSLLVIILGLIFSIIGTERAFNKDIEWMKVLGPLFLGVFFTIITQNISVFVIEYRKESQEHKELNNKFSWNMNMLLIESKEEKVDFYGLSLTKAFENLFEFLITNLHKLKRYASNDKNEEHENLYRNLRKIDRMKYRIVPNDSDLLKHTENQIFQVRAKMEIEKLMKKAIEDISKISLELIE